MKRSRLPMATGCALLAEHAAAFALVLLRADAAGDGGQRVVFAHLRGGGQIIARVDEGHDFFDLDADRAIELAAGLGAGDAARGLGDGRGCGQALVHFFKVAARTSASSSGMCTRGIFMRSLSGKRIASQT